jgi:hypothetical protein
LPILITVRTDQQREAQMSDLDTELAEELAALRSEPAADTGVHPEDGDQEAAEEETTAGEEQQS